MSDDQTGHEAMKPNALQIAVAQIEPVVGDIAGNVTRIREAVEQARDQGADLVVFCELVICGYPPEDLVQKPSFQAACREAVEGLAVGLKDGPGVILGTPWRDGDHLYNSAVLIDGGAISAQVHKVRLPNYGVFDEPRRFTPGAEFPDPVEFRGHKLGLVICEDMWLPGACEALQKKGAQMLIAPHGSPFRTTAIEERTAAARARCNATQLDLLFVNQLAGQDEVVFEGASFVMSASGETRYRAPQFIPGIFMTRWEEQDGALRAVDGPQAQWVDGMEMIYRAVTLGVRDYVNKNRFPGVVIGLSGGVDSALTAAIAVDALGAARVHCVMLPSRYTSDHSLEDAKACAELLGIRYDTLPISPAVSAFDEVLKDIFAGREADTTEENIQSRIRGVLLMALSNKFGHMVLTTGNKSEMSVGYATLYGDMNGGYNPLKDIYKMDVFRLCQWRNKHSAIELSGPSGLVIPERIITKPPSAELREDQKDEDSLPPYEILDAILERLVERECSVAEIVAEGYEEAVVRRIEHLLYVAEYKRRQAPPGPKVTAVNFGRDRRYPITNGWRSR